MSDVKAAEVYALPRDSESQEDENVSNLKGSTAADKRDMLRLGKIQELRRNFSFVPIFGYAMILMSSWECMLT